MHIVITVDMRYIFVYSADNFVICLLQRDKKAFREGRECDEDEHYRKKYYRNMMPDWRHLQETVGSICVENGHHSHEHELQQNLCF